MDFSESSFLFHSPIILPGGGGMPLCSSCSSSWAPGLGLEEVYRLMKLDHCPPGVFSLGREVYKRKSRFSFSESFQRDRGLRTSESAEAERKWGGVWLLSYLDLVPVLHVLPIVPMPDPQWCCGYQRPGLE